jgi:transcriptional regulator GlxA family with amidase domain
MTITVGILLFEGVEELDFVGPWEVLTMASSVIDQAGSPVPKLTSLLLAEKLDPVRCAKGMRVLPDATLDEHPKLDVLLVPGGLATRHVVENLKVLEWIARVAGGCEWVTSVCTGALLLTAAGPAKGKRVTTHWGFIEGLRARGEAKEVLEGVRFVRDGNVVTSSGVSAGIDMTIWLVGQLYSPDLARTTMRYMQYDPAPPYTAEV